MVLHCTGSLHGCNRSVVTYPVSEARVAVLLLCEANAATAPNTITPNGKKLFLKFLIIIKFSLVPTVSQGFGLSLTAAQQYFYS